MAQEAEQKWVTAKMLRDQILSGDSNVHVPLGTEWEGGGGTLSSCGPKGLVTSSPPGKALWPRSQSHLCAQSLPEVESQDLRGTAV